MALYTKQFTKSYPNGYVDKPQKTTPVTAEILNMQDDTLAALEDFLISDDVGFKDKLTVGTRNAYASQQGACTLTSGENNSAQGKDATAFGFNCTASGNQSHAEGHTTTASALYAHAEGQMTESTAMGSHAEGAGTKAGGNYSHAEGVATKAIGHFSHAEGNTTIASGNNQHVQGKYNIEDTESKYAHIVGGGTSNNDRKNIHTLDWQGNAVFAGDVINGNGVSLDELAESIDNAPVSAAQQAAIDAAYQQAAGYTNQKIAELINGAPETLDTLGEIAQAMEDNDDVVEALQQAIGSKASQAEFDGHTSNDTIHITASERQAWNDKQTKTGDTMDNTVTFTSGDSTNPTGWADVDVVTSGEKLSSLMRKFSLFAKNVRYLWKLLGSTSISGIGDGTVTGAISSLNTGLTWKYLGYNNGECRFNLPAHSEIYVTVDFKSIQSQRRTLLIPNLEEFETELLWQNEDGTVDYVRIYYHRSALGMYFASNPAGIDNFKLSVWYR